MITDWITILKELSDAGITQAQIAKSTGTTRASIQYLSCGKTVDPSYKTGRKILALHSRHVKKDQEGTEAQIRQAEILTLISVKDFIDRRLKGL